MKKLYWIILALMLLLIAGTVAFLIVGPDKVPMHFNAAGEVDRIGSKYEMLIFPGVALLIGAPMVFAARASAKNPEKNNEKVMLISAIALVAMMTVICFYMIVKSLTLDPGAAEKGTAQGITRIVCLCMGVMMIVLGNIMPKAKMNSSFGLRTSWSMKNEEVWRKSQRAGAIITVFTGAVIILLGLVLSGNWCIYAMLAAVVLMAVISTLATRRIYMKYKAEKEAAGDTEQ